ncbi:hypothetical protein GCM10022243_33000 [Saccharothrix violaceirubra]|uniref:Lysozyme family protein n=1 Tax=Saccharothrix violaceirubra TaxID=413306 RepID=A0A7W7T0Q3_9PSEU|nr:hypothetical protein [Saccharothrix violaceirubra]MBB4964151.1 lysozyme family protein [Saccharothrix violaceirubra]
MTKTLVVIGLLALAGFLAGGVYATWKTTRGLAIALAVLVVVALGGAVAWYLG